MALEFAWPLGIVRSRNSINPEYIVGCVFNICKIDGAQCNGHYMWS